MSCLKLQRKGGDKKLVLDGDFSRVKWIGCRMSDGEIVVKGSVGANCGAYMAGGKITIEATRMTGLEQR